MPTFSARPVTERQRTATAATVVKVLRLRAAHGVVLSEKESEFLRQHDRCYFADCGAAVTHEATKRFGDRGTFRTCAAHVPGGKRPTEGPLAELPMAYDVRAL